jgi:hypothetical protein
MIQTDNSAFRVYVALARKCWKKPRCFPRQQTIADSARVSIDTVRRAIQKLEAVGLVVVEERGGGRKSTTYFLPDMAAIQAQGQRSRATPAPAPVRVEGWHSCATPAPAPVQGEEIQGKKPNQTAAAGAADAAAAVLKNRLKGIGMDGAVAESIVQQHPGSRISAALEAVERREGIRNPPGFVRTALAGNYEFPVKKQDNGREKSLAQMQARRDMYKAMEAAKAADKAGDAKAAAEADARAEALLPLAYGN